MTEATKGVLAMVGACVIWGFSALYYKLLADIPPLEDFGASHAVVGLCFYRRACASIATG